MLLKQGSYNLHVVKLQAMLRGLGFLEPNFVIDGKYNFETREAVLAYQLRNKSVLAVDGVAGPQTFSFLNNSEGDKLLFLFLHCAATPEGRNDKANDIAAYHTRPTEKGGKGWSRPGYSDIIELNGKIVNVWEWEQLDYIPEEQRTWGVKFETGLNNVARHVCYVGGMDKDLKLVKDTRTFEQSAALEAYVKFHIARFPSIIVAGHNQIQRKGCPSFFVPEWLESIGVGEKNILRYLGDRVL